MGANISRTLKALRRVDGHEVCDSGDRSHARHGHQLSAGRIAANGVKDHLMEDRTLLAKSGTGDKHRAQHCLKPRIVGDEIKRALLEARLGDAAGELKTEDAQRPSYLIFEVDLLHKQCLSIGEEHSKFLTDAALDVNDAVPSHPHDLCDRTGVVAIGFDGHCLRHATKPSRVNADRRKTFCAQLGVKPARDAPDLEPDFRDGKLRCGEPGADIRPQ
jgi:hypothetical protein